MFFWDEGGGPWTSKNGRFWPNSAFFGANWPPCHPQIHESRWSHALIVITNHFVKFETHLTVFKFCHLFENKNVVIWYADGYIFWRKKVTKVEHDIWPPKPPKICTKGIPMEASHKTGPYEAIKVIWNYTLGRGGVIEGQNSPKSSDRVPKEMDKSS